MATKSNAGGTVFESVDVKFSAGRMSEWPQECLGDYRNSSFTGLLTAVAAGGELFNFRWTDAANLAVIKYLKVRFAVITGFTATQELAFDVVQATNWSTVGSGGTAIAPTATNLMKRSTYPQSKVGDLRISTTGALTAGTKTFFGSSIMTDTKKTLAAAATVQDADFEASIELVTQDKHPIILLQNEGIVVRNTIAMGAIGTVRATVDIAWSEFLNANYPTL